MNHLHMHKCRHAFIEAHTCRQPASIVTQLSAAAGVCIPLCVCLLWVLKKTEGLRGWRWQQHQQRFGLRDHFTSLVSDKHWISAVIWPSLTPALNQDLELSLPCVEERCSHLPGLTQSGVGPHEDLWLLIP